MAELLQASFLSGYLELVEELGGDPTDLLRALRIPRRVFLNRDQVLDQRAASLLLERSAQTFACPDFGIRLTARQDISVAGPLAVVMRNSSTLGNAFRDIARYLAVVGPAPRMAITQVPKSKDMLLGTELRMRGAGAFPQTMELFVSGMHRVLLLLSEGRAHPKEVFLQHAAISSPETYRRTFAAPVRFSHPFAGLIISSSDWSRGIEGGNSLVHQVARAYLDLQLEARPPDLGSQVRRLVVTLLASGKCQRNEIADVLNLHPRTLIRRLSDESTSFEKIVDQERAALAERLLSQKGTSLSQIAALLGYSEQSSFTRSFRRWFRKSPSEVRRRLHKTPRRQ